MAKKAIFLVLSTLMFLLLSQPVEAQDNTGGKKMYVTYCSGCHGETGKGDGPAARSLPVKPANHTDAATMGQLSDKDLFEIISRGGSGVGKSPYMPAWGGQLKEKQIRDIIGYIRTLSHAPIKKRTSEKKDQNSSLPLDVYKNEFIFANKNSP